MTPLFNTLECRGWSVSVPLWEAGQNAKRMCVCVLCVCVCVCACACACVCVCVLYTCISVAELQRRAQARYEVAKVNGVLIQKKDNVYPAFLFILSLNSLLIMLRWLPSLCYQCTTALHTGRQWGDRGTGVWVRRPYSLPLETVRGEETHRQDDWYCVQY